MVKNKKIHMSANAILLLVMSLILSGCATNKAMTNKIVTSETITAPQDPYEHVNRQIFAFNMALDRAVFRPIAKVYDFILPWPVKKGVHNIFENIGDVTSAANEILQLDFPQAISDLARVVINTTIGIGGLFDVATLMGIEKDTEDFGMTLAHWGSRNTPYVVLPIFGPSTIRDAVGLSINMVLLDPWTYGASTDVQLGAFGAYYTHRRASLLIGDKVVDQAFDPYIFIRDAYLQRRDYLIQENDKRSVNIYVADNGIKHRETQTLKKGSFAY